MNLKKYLFTLLMSTLILFIFFSTSFADNTELKASSPACILIDSESGKIIYEKNAYEKMYPASTTKIMTAIIAIENCNLSDIATVSPNAVSIESVPEDYTRADLLAGEKLTIENLLNVLLIPSANDAAIVLAEHVSGSVENFANEMNKKAKELGCTNTNFVNPNGVHNKDQYTTAYDMALIGKYAMKNKIFRSIVCKTTYTLPSSNKYEKEDRTFKNTNELLSSKKYKYEYTTGVKTGYTDKALNCIVASAKKDNYEFIAVIFGADKTSTGENERAVDCINMFNYAINNFYEKDIMTENQIVKQIPIKTTNDSEETLDILIEKNIKVTTAVDIKKLTPTITINEKIGTPILKGFVVGKISYNIDGIEYSSNLIAGNNIVSSDILPTVFSVLSIILIISILISLFQIRKNKKSRNKNRKNDFIMKFYR